MLFKLVLVSLIATSALAAPYRPYQRLFGTHFTFVCLGLMLMDV